jgi:hypothetical protein
MSWDIVLFNSSEKITAPEDLDDTKLIPIDFCSILENHFEGIIKDEDHREIRGKDFSICYFSDNEYASNILLNLYGESALYQLMDLSIKNNWQIFDTGLGEMIDLNNPSKNGYKNFQAYLNQILNDKNI